MSHDISRLIQGYQEFRDHYFDGTNSIYDQLVRHGQQPKILMIGCSDSRVDPAIIMNCQPGDLFVIRNVANLVPPYEKDNGYHGTSAALEFGVCMLGVEHIIIFGHTECGGIRALLENNQNVNASKSFINKWMEIAQPAHQVVLEKHAQASFEEKTTFCEQYALINSFNNLQTFPWIKEKFVMKTLFLHAWYFDLSEGIIYAFDREQQTFKELTI
jgi:carbonic anhydrase